MSLFSTAPLLLLPLLVLSLFSSAAAVISPLTLLPTSKPTAYEVLESFNFPAGLLPKGATGYDLDPDTGKFTAYFNGTCSFALEGSYQLRYQKTVTGRISANKLRDLKGVSVKVLLFWINIVEVQRRGDELDFSVGIASADFPIDNFYEVPQCGCGLNCENGVEKVRLRGSGLMGIW